MAQFPEGTGLKKGGKKKRGKENRRRKEAGEAKNESRGSEREQGAGE